MGTRAADARSPKRWKQNPRVEQATYARREREAADGRGIVVMAIYATGLSSRRTRIWLAPCAVVLALAASAPGARGQDNAGANSPPNVAPHPAASAIDVQKSYGLLDASVEPALA